MAYPIEAPEVAEVFTQYPDAPRTQLLELRQIIYETVAGMDTLTQLEETLKWGEPSYRCKTGSTIRIDWKETTPDQIYLYFHCTSKLGETFKALYRDQLQFQGNRAIVLSIDDKLPRTPLKHCIALALDYHRLKHLPMLGA